MAKLTRKSYQRKAMVVGATAFAGIALVATGFAAWVISSSASKILNGKVNIGKVDDKSITLNASVSSEKKNFSFEPLENDVSGRVRWDKTNSENLKITVSGDFSPAFYVNRFSIMLRIGTESEITEAGTGKTKWETNFENAANTKKFITLPTEVWCQEKTFVIDDLPNKASATDTKEFTLDIAFGWGDTFGKVNPSTYYDDVLAGQKVSDDDLKRTMQDFYDTMTAGIVGDEEIPFRVIVKADTTGAKA